jgi:hypothetical protein
VFIENYTRLCIFGSAGKFNMAMCLTGSELIQATPLKNFDSLILKK